ncbi:MAG: glycosyltransferase [Syntrophomonas sp.]
MKIVHLITDLDTGGAEMMLFKLMQKMDKSRYKNIVVSLMNEGTLGHRFIKLGVPVYCLDMKRSSIVHSFKVLKLLKLLRHERPDIVQTWMYHCDLIGGLASAISGRIPVAWNIRQSNLDSKVNKKTTILIAKICALISSRIPDVIICGSEKARQVHRGMGYNEQKMVVIPNGFDIEAFHPDIEARLSVRRELGLRENAFLIGLVARYDAQKDHRTFLLAANKIAASHGNVHFILCGDNVTWSNRELTSWIGEHRNQFHLLGRRTDISRITASFDLACSSSLGEGFANVIGEAMACGVPCVVTDVGDSALIVGETGLVVPPGSYEALAGAFERFLSLSHDSRQALSFKAREKVEQSYNLPKIVDKYVTVYEEIVNHVRNRRFP